jgi:hypothetical protein
MVQLNLFLVRSKLNKGFFNRLTSYMYSMYVSHRRDGATFCLLNTSVENNPRIVELVFVSSYERATAVLTIYSHRDR